VGAGARAVPAVQKTDMFTVELAQSHHGTKYPAKVFAYAETNEASVFQWKWLNFSCNLPSSGKSMVFYNPNLNAGENGTYETEAITRGKRARWAKFNGTYTETDGTLKKFQREANKIYSSVHDDDGTRYAEGSSVEHLLDKPFPGVSVKYTGGYQTNSYVGTWQDFVADQTKLAAGIAALKQVLANEDAHWLGVQDLLRRCEATETNWKYQLPDNKPVPTTMKELVTE
jgi:hypothetical protein